MRAISTMIVFALAIPGGDNLPYPLKVGAAGYIPGTSLGRIVWVKRVIDDDTMIVQVRWHGAGGGPVGKAEVIIKGVSTKEAVDGEVFEVDAYLTVGRGVARGRTMFSLEPEKKAKE